MLCSKFSGFVGRRFNFKQVEKRSTAIKSNKITPPSQDGDCSGKRRYQAIFFAAYIFFGMLHELFHVLAAKIIVELRSSSTDVAEDKPFLSLSSSIGKFLSRAVFGRYTIVTIPSVATNADGAFMSNETAASIITHSGWIMSLLLALGMHYFYANTSKHAFSPRSAAQVAPTFILAAYVAAMESITSDLMGFVPKLVNNFLHLGSSSPSSIHLLLHCGNFGIILLNSQWINVDGGQRALSVLEKMVEVTMMRGAQSGGVVTFEPTSSGGGDWRNANPVIKGVRSRVVNAKRTVLSEGVRKKIEKDSCGLMSGGKLKGWNDAEFNATDDGSSSVAAKRLVRAFFGHTRFATSSKASMDGTHPHQWSPRHTFKCYGFQSKEGALQGEDELDVSKKDELETSLHKMIKSRVGTGMAGGVEQARNVMRVEPKGQSMGVENFVTHNGEFYVPINKASLSFFNLIFLLTSHITHLSGDFEFYKIGGKYYDCEAIQEWLVRTLHVPMPATVDSAAIAGMIDLLRVQGCFALSVRYAVCFELGGDVGPTDSSVIYPTTAQYEAIGKIFEKVLDEMVKEDRIKTMEQISSSTTRRKYLCGMIKSELLPLIKADNSVVSCLSNFVTTDEECGNFDQFVNATVDAFFDNDLLNTVRLFLKNAKGSFGLCVTTSLDAHRQVAMAAKGQTLCIAFYPRKGLICYGSEQAAVKVRSGSGQKMIVNQIAVNN